MYGEDSSGRKVSLLNDESTRKSTRPRLLQYTHRARSSVSSSMSRDDYTSSSSSISLSPGVSPATPQLSHIDTLSSLETRSTPSPMTPNYHFDPLDQSKNQAPYYGYHRSPTGLGYPTMPPQPDVSVQPYYHQMATAHRMTELEMEPSYHPTSRSALQPLQTRLSYQNPDPAMSPLSPPNSMSTPVIPPSGPSTPAVTTPTNSAAKPIKKKYPCPHAVRYACHDTFTTSGHAARHGKKHTGEKNILCPTCNKAFTRKDNMKQHERTHKPSRLDSGSVAPAAPAATTTSSSSPTISSSTTKKHQLSSSGSTSRRRMIHSRSRSRSQPAAPDVSAMELDLHPLPPSDYPIDPSRSLADQQHQHQQQQQQQHQQHQQQQQQQQLLHGTTSNQQHPAYLTRMDSMSGRSEEDGEGESPGLDALATAASGMIDT